jgi:hypothetical protein
MISNSSCSPSKRKMLSVVGEKRPNGASMTRVIGPANQGKIARHFLETLKQFFWVCKREIMRNRLTVIVNLSVHGGGSGGSVFTRMATMYSGTFTNCSTGIWSLCRTSTSVIYRGRVQDKYYRRTSITVKSTLERT